MAANSSRASALAAVEEPPVDAHPETGNAPAAASTDAVAEEALASEGELPAVDAATDDAPATDAVADVEVTPDPVFVPAPDQLRFYNLITNSNGVLVRAERVG